MKGSFVLKNTGLVLEGGGMRGVYTAGILEYFLEQDLFFPYIIGVSAGACNAASYISRQKGRNRKVNIDYVNHPEYISYKKFLKERQLFGMDFIFNELPTKLVPFDFETFNQAAEHFVVGTTDCVTGEPVYLTREDYREDILMAIRASSSLPFVAPVVEFRNRKLLDGGLSDPIPIKKAQAENNTKNVIVLTQEKGYRKSKPKMEWLLKRSLRDYPQIGHVMSSRYRIYNETLDYIEEQEEKGNVFVFRPESIHAVGRVERNPIKLAALYEEGYNQAEQQIEELQNWLNT
ncbi:patatin family protein [Bacillus luteolus]|uniref:Patatin family protein n=1 Tax=Litchfieldia luteola TaxID=682179 RepID=A0ABR9QM40_9BACI|nr:patatin family protein [Cytobacillus luteolus]MBE4909578.1 patatin family protein [Cytobacillus luteolus]